MPAKTCNQFSLKLVILRAMSENWLTRLSEAVDRDGRTPRAISRSAGLGPNYLGELLKGKVPGIDKLLRLCAEMNVSATWVLTGAEVTTDGEEMLGHLSKLSADQQTTLLDLARQLRAARR